MKIRLTEWAARNFDPPPHRNTLMKWRAEGFISPPPIYIGRAYYVEENARFVGGQKEAPRRPDLKAKHQGTKRKQSLVERIIDAEVIRIEGTSSAIRRRRP